MRTFPKSLATFRKIVDLRGERLRRLSFEELAQLAPAPIEHIEVESDSATIAVIVQPRPRNGIRVVIQGFMKARFVPFLKHVALDGFYKYPDGNSSNAR
jgi:hypothetical protein